MPGLVRIGLAQTGLQDSLGGNVEHHLHFIEAARDHALDLLVFPELSLTGYTISPDEGQILRWNDAYLLRLETCCREQGLHAAVGLPVRIGELLFIGQIFFTPAGNRFVYCKKHLYGAEKATYAPGAFHNVLTVSGVQIGLAICADFDETAHARETASAGAELYIASALISTGGYDASCGQLRERAVTQGFPVMLANWVGAVSGWQCAGGSALWSQTGECVVQAPMDRECLVACQLQAGVVFGQSVYVA